MERTLEAGGKFSRYQTVTFSATYKSTLSLTAMSPKPIKLTYQIKPIGTPEKAKRKSLRQQYLGVYTPVWLLARLMPQ